MHLSDFSNVNLISKKERKKKKISSVSSGSKVCNNRDLLYSCQVLKKLVSCFLNSPSRRTKVLFSSTSAYVIELLSPPPPTPGVSGVRVDISTLPNWNLYLLIKSPPGLEWTLVTPTVNGKMEIVVRD